MNIQELINKRAKAWEEAKSFVSAHENDKGILSAEDTATYNKMEAEIEEITNSINRAQKMAQRDAMLSQPVDTPVVNMPGAAAPTAKAGRDSEEYKNAMLKAFRTQFRNTAELDALNEGSDSAGGYLVPTEYDRRLIQKMTDTNVMRQLATVITTSGEHKINIADSDFAAAWIDEGEALTWGTTTFSQKTLDAHKLHVAVRVTEELLYDNAFNLESYIIDKFGTALGNKEEDAFLNGNGSGCPTGIFDATNGGTFSVTDSQIKADKLNDLVYALKRPYRRNAAFVLNDSTIAQIRKLKDGSGAYIWQPSYTAGEPDRLLGYPIYTSAFAPTTAIAFGDFSFYNIGDRGQRSFQTLRELFAGNGMIGYVAKERVDGILVLKEAVQIYSITASN